ncbi:chorismate mutase aro7 [Tulasnella sp. JGI-2019a]|nr:chorismate mutase aro7 [Tulasnella sp. JGI-2019a]
MADSFTVRPIPRRRRLTWMQQNFFNDREDPLSLERIRNVLVRLEDTIIFCIIERAQFALNPRIYQRGAFKELTDLGFSGSWLEWFLKEIETFHAKARRYTSPDEYPFTKGLPGPLIPALKFPQILYDHPNCMNLNVNPSILSFYTRSVVPRVTQRATLNLASRNRAMGIQGDEEYEDDGNYGSAATIDVELLHAISKRVHYGKFVSESKFREHPALFVPHILQKDRTALEDLITKPAVERALLARLIKKTTIYGADLGMDGEPVRASKSPKTPSNLRIRGLPAHMTPRMDMQAKALPKVEEPLLALDGDMDDEFSVKIDVEEVKRMYETWIIPLTKEVEVEYLLHRLDGMNAEQIDALQQQHDVTTMPPT